MTASSAPDDAPSGDGPSTRGDGRRAQVVLLAGPSGSGKSHLAERAGLPVICLDDFYRDGDDPTLPRSELGIVDWDDPRAWNAEAAFAALTRLADHGRAEIPIYELAHDRAIATRAVDLGGARVFVAEGIFAAELIDRCRQAGILADAMCLAHRPIVTFWRRLVRDLREGRKAPLTLLRRGWLLRREEPAIVAHQVGLGARPVNGHDALRKLERLARPAALPGDGQLAA